MAKKTIPWYEFDKKVEDLDTDVAYQLQVQREAIPLIFVPGLLGTCLRLSGTDGWGASGKTGLPNSRWYPSSLPWMFLHFIGRSGAYRKKMLVGPRFFNAGFLEPDNDKIIGDGFKAILSDYCKFLNLLKKPEAGGPVAKAVGGKGPDWGPLSKIFEFPVYAFGYNWTDSNRNSGKKLAKRIEEIIEEARKVTGLCERVILITHSMGGLVARWASKMEKAEESILGIIHGVQPATGAPSAYWRMKAGFEREQAYGYIEEVILSTVKGVAVSSVFGSTGDTVTPLFANIPSVLQLLPNKLHRTNDGEKEWLRITQDGKTIKALPESNPYEEIYRIKAEVRPKGDVNPSSNKYWGLVDPEILDPECVPEGGEGETGEKWKKNRLDRMTDQLVARAQAWKEYNGRLDRAEEFHDELGDYQHPQTFNLRGIGQPTADVVELRIESVGKVDNPYPKREFRGFFRNSKGKLKRAVLQQPEGDGDGTVPRSSAGALDNLDANGKQLPGDQAASVGHQGAYEDLGVQKFAIEAIKALCRVRFETKTGRILDKFPAP